MKRKIKLFEPSIGKDEENAINRVLKSKFWASGAGMVTATVNGKGELKRLSIDPKLVDPAEVEVLEDLIVAAFTDAKGRAEDQVQEEMKTMTGGFPIPPGMKLF